MDIETVENDEIEIDLRELLLHFKKFWYLLVGGIIVGLILAETYICFLQVPQYSSSAMIYIRGASSSISLQDLQLNSELTNDFVVILTSRPVLEEVITAYDLPISYGELKSKVSINNLTDTRILQISVTWDDPNLAANLSNKIAELGVEKINEIESKAPYMIENAVVNKVKVNGSDKKTMAIGAMGGFVLVLGVLGIQFILNDRFKSLDDIEGVLNIPVLSTVVEVKELSSKKGRKK